MSSGFEGNITELIEVCPVAGGFAGGMLGGALVALGLFLVMLFIAGFYVYTSLAWYAIAKKLKYKKAWMVWIPVVRIIPVLTLGGFHWAWIFLVLIPIFGWIALFVLFIIALWRIFVKLKVPAWFSLALIIPEIGGVLYLISIGIAAWKK